jgi:glycoside hydrolase-like protein
MPIGFDADQDCSHVAADAFAKGVEFVCRYYKNLGLAEARALSAAGLKIVSIWETTAKRALAGAGAGKIDGGLARNAGAALGQWQGSAIYATADFGEVQGEDAAVFAYLAAFKEALGGQAKLGVYGEGAVCQSALDLGLADYTWLAGGMGMRGSRAFAASGRATIVQDVGDKRVLDLGIDIDSDEARVDDYGGWHLAT